MNAKSKFISFNIKDSIAFLGFGYNNSKKMSVLNEDVLNELDHHIEHLQSHQSEIKGVIFFSHLEKCFLAGADISLIAKINTEADGAEAASFGQKIFTKIEDLKMHTICCVNGVCMGGGFELALSCNTICATSEKSTVFALPEVKLGLIPGFGGTYRLPLKIGLPASLDLILSGKSVNAKKAKKIGICHDVYFKEKILDSAKNIILSGKKYKKQKNLKQKLENIASDNVIAKKIIFQKARENVLSKTKGLYQAPLRILETMESSMSKSRSAYLDMEASAFGELSVSKQSKNLQHIFFMQESAKKYSGPQSSSDRKLKRGAVLGAGTMGGGIAWLMASNKMSPIMKDLNSDALQLGLKQASSNFRGELKRKKICHDQFERNMHSISCQLDYSGFRNMDLVVEAVIEKMEIKKSVFSEVEKYVDDKTLITSNTSSLSVEEMSKALKDSSRFAGLHFFNPVHKMPLVEIIRHSKVSSDTLKSLYNWCLQVKKTPIIVKDGPGFLVNRILMPFLNEAGHLLEEGVSIQDLDKACENFGFPMGPCRLLDEVGIDVASKVANILFDGLGERVTPSKFIDKLIQKNFLGRKTNIGFFQYNEKGKVESINEEVVAMLPQKHKSMPMVEIQMRVILPMINEASHILDEKIVESAREVDQGLIFGIGFPPFRGGLLRYADEQGGDKILEMLNKYKESVDKNRYNASSYFENLVKNKSKFYEN